MKSNNINTRTFIFIILLVVAVMLVFILVTNSNKIENSNTANESLNTAENNTQQDSTANVESKPVAGTNYSVTSNGSKLNTSESVSADKKVGAILIEKSKIVFENSMSKLSSKVTNDDTDKENLTFKVKFLAADKTVIAESVGYVGPIKANETRTIDSYISIDVSNAIDVVYEIVK